MSSYRALLAETPPLASGCPRPYQEYPKPSQHFPHKRLPVPWINTENVWAMKDWLSFDRNAMRELHQADYCLCAICGEQLDRLKVYGTLYYPGRTTGSGMHPGCALLSLHYCPYLAEFDPTEFFVSWEGEGHGLILDESTLDEEEDDGTYDLTDVNLAPGWKLISLAEIKALAKRLRETKAAVSPAQAAPSGCPMGH